MSADVELQGVNNQRKHLLHSVLEIKLFAPRFADSKKTVEIDRLYSNCRTLNIKKVKSIEVLLKRK